MARTDPGSYCPGAHEGVESIIVASNGLNPLFELAPGTPSTPVRVYGEISVQADMAGGGTLLVETSNDGVTWTPITLADGSPNITANGNYPLCWQANLVRFTPSAAGNAISIGIPGN